MIDKIDLTLAAFTVREGRNWKRFPDSSLVQEILEEVGRKNRYTC